MIENGFVLLPMEAPWLADYLAELTAFPDNRQDKVDRAAARTDRLWCESYAWRPGPTAGIDPEAVIAGGAKIKKSAPREFGPKFEGF